MKKKAKAKIIRSEEIACDIYSLWLETDLANQVQPGQFIGVYPNNASTLLPRPISICEAEVNSLRLVYRAVGKGTAEFATLQSGNEVNILGLLGNGYDLSTASGRRVALMAGGIGVPPMVELAKRIKQEGKANSIDIYVGYRNADTFLIDELKSYGEVHIATEDGSVGSKGNVMDALRDSGVSPEVLYACGPMPMLRAIKNYAADCNIDAYISLEERMACGVGACLGCVCKTTHKDAHSHVNNARICTDGPVFEAREVEI